MDYSFFKQAGVSGEGWCWWFSGRWQMLHMFCQQATQDDLVQATLRLWVGASGFRSGLNGARHPPQI
jgi:hypothetical protein